MPRRSAYPGRGLIFARARWRNRALLFLERLGFGRPLLIDHQMPQGPVLALRQGTVDEVIAAEIGSGRLYPLDGLGLGPGDLVIDVGAQIGVFSLLAATAGARVIACEPAPSNFRLLRANIARNGLEDRIEALQMAVWRPGSRSLKIHESADNMGGHAVVAALGPATRVPARSLAELLDERGVERCRLLKIDAEGSEYAILYGADEATLRRFDHIYLEAHEYCQLGTLRRPQEPEYSGRGMAAHLDQLGFEVREDPKARCLYATLRCTVRSRVADRRWTNEAPLIE